MALKVKTIEASAQKWEGRATIAADVFAAEAEAAADLWAKNAAAAKDNYRVAITAPGIAERFVGGIKRAGAAKFARKIRDVAKDRYAPGISAAVVDYKERVEPFFATLAALVLDPRKPRGDPANYKRVEQVGKALHAKKLALLGVTAS